MLATEEQLQELEEILKSATLKWTESHGLILDSELKRQISDSLICEDENQGWEQMSWPSMPRIFRV